MKKNILIIGFGEIGSSIAKLYDLTKYDVCVKELNRFGLFDGKNIIETVEQSTFKEIEVMHVCIGYSDKFKNIVVNYINEWSPKLTIINSTVPVGTTTDIYENIYEEEDMKREIVHSPVMGVHPNLTQSILTFNKIVAGCTPEATELACKHFSDIEVETYIFDKPEESELAKMCSTTYYAVCIRFMQELHNECKTLCLDFENVYTATNNIYNEGYSQMNRTDVIRPILRYMGNDIKGHCLMPNIKLLEDSNMLKLVTAFIKNQTNAID